MYSVDRIYPTMKQGGKIVRKKLFSVIAGILCCSVLFIACSRTPNKSYIQNTSVKEVIQYKLHALTPGSYGEINGLSLEPGSYISIIGSNSNDSYWNEIKAGAEQAVADLNEALEYVGDDKIKLSYCAPENPYDLNEQINLLDKEIARLPIAVSIAAIDPTAYTIQFHSAADTKVPVITFDSACNYENIGTHISTDNIKATETAATELAKLMGEEGQVAIFVQDSVSTSSQQRIQGFLNTLSKQYPKMSVSSIYYMNELDAIKEVIAADKNASATNIIDVKPEDISEEEVITYILENNSNLKGIYTTNLDTTQLVANALIESNHADLAFIGFDGGPEQIALLQNELVDGLIIQNPFAMGYATVVAAARLSLGLANESFVDSGFTFVTKENMTQDSINKMLY